MTISTVSPTVSPFVVPSTRCSLHHWVFQHHDQATGIFLMQVQRAIECTVFPSVTSEGTPVFTLLPEALQGLALQGLQTRLIPRQTREKPSHIPPPTTTAIHLIGSKSSSRHLSVPSLCTLSSMSTQSLLFLECLRSPPTRSVAKLPLFLSFWTAHRDPLCALVPAPSLYVTPHSSTTCATML